MVLSVHSRVGGYAENKDIARDIRIKHILPALAAKFPLVVDFTDVQDATQSFIHACISEAIVKFGEDALKLLEFRGCCSVVKSNIRTVVEYTLNVLEYAPKSATGRRLPTVDVIQAENLDLVRAVVAAVAEGAGTIDELTARTQVSRRHCEYRSHAARVLGFLQMQPRLSVTEAGKVLIQTRPNSEAERQHLEQAILRSPAINLVAPDLLDAVSPTSEVIKKRIMEFADLGDATSERRAKSLLGWRNRIFTAQLKLYDVDSIYNR